MGLNNKLDDLDKRIIRVLSEDGRIPVKNLVDRLDISNPTINSRMKNLINSGVLKIAGLVDIFRTKGLILALVAIRVKDDSKMDETLTRISELDDVHSAMAVTGRYDIFAEVVFAGEMEALYNFMSQKLPALENIGSSESFVVMKSKKKWLLLPPGLINRWD
ncbi:MAG: Lrp/AsnC family transcriptional regulator [Desulfuromusa sp.]|nr:Lrp/AsnC family transcriptional regulator [Desulfuromusa sp.]